jgi:hypothetical protein
MSGSLALATSSFTDAEKADIRRFCGYPAYGAGASGFQSWRFFQQYGELEYRMNNLAPAEYQVVRQFLAALYPLEAAIPNAGANLDTAQASVWVHNKAEVADRLALYRSWQVQLTSFLGVPPGPSSSSARTGAIVI